jgi:hypothetical protein
VNDALGRLLQPHEPAAGEFHEALLGLASLSRAVDALLARCPDVEETAIGGDEESELAYAILGLVSLRTTFLLTLEALLGEEERGEAGTPGAAWHRGHLR